MKHVCNFGDDVDLYLSGGDWILDVEGDRTVFKELTEVLSYLVEEYVKRRVSRRPESQPVRCLLEHITSAKTTALVAAEALQKQFNELIKTLKRES